jgi:hypothetical protein
MAADHSSTPRSRSITLITCLVAALLLTACTAGGRQTPTVSQPPPPAADPFVPPFAGTLGTQPAHAEQEYANGVRVAMVELNWSRYEPEQGRFDLSYEGDMRSRVAALRAAGLQVTLGLGLHFTPRWVLDQPDSRYIDEEGNASGQVDLTFNAAIRTQAERFLQRAVAVLGAANLWAVRISSGGRSEVLYPNGGYWAFGRNALGGADLPATLGPNPYPEFRPGTSGLSQQELARWYEWYLGALVDTADWQMRVVRDAGFDGYFQILTPGVGVLPAQLQEALKANLPDGLTGLGAVWHEVYRLLPDKRNVVAYVSSMGDGSGDNRGCGVLDDRIPLSAAAAVSWSSVRWIKRIADEYGLETAGENPGYNASPEYQQEYRDSSADGLMAVTFAQARSCSLQGVYWAHDDQLWDGTVAPERFFSFLSSDAVAPPPAPTA